MREPEEHKETLPVSSKTLAYDGTSDGSGRASGNGFKDQADAGDPLKRVGTLLDEKYEVVKLIGEGGMGAVYEARHKVIGRKVAVKFLRSDFTSDQQALQRFVREAQIAGSLGHGNICEVTDIGETADGVPYMLMPLLEGRSLAEEMNQSTDLFGSKRVFDLVYQVLTGLQRAHDAGIVHRDLKPENIFLTCMGDREDFVKILDFGISKVDESVAGVESGITRTGMVLGTPHYMSPEQARGRREVDYRTDIYAVAVILYEMLTGVLPFDGETYNEIIIGIVTDDLVPPRSHSKEISAGVDRVIVKALARDPDERYETAREFKHALIAAARDSWMSLPHYLGVSFTGEVPALTSSQIASEPEAEPESEPNPETGKPAVGQTALSDAEPLELPRRAWWKPVAGIGGAAVLVAVLVVALSTGGSRKSESPESSSPTSDPSATMGAPLDQTPGFRPVEGSLVTVRFVGVPPQGRVTVADTPAPGGVIRLERSSVEQRYRVTAPGHESATGTITPDRQREVTVRLKRLSPALHPMVRNPPMARRRPHMRPRPRRRVRPRPPRARMGRLGTQLDGDYDGDN